jgi:hypothetical protein
MVTDWLALVCHRRGEIFSRVSFARLALAGVISADRRTTGSLLMARYSVAAAANGIAKPNAKRTFSRKRMTGCKINYAMPAANAIVDTRFLPALCSA